MRTLSRGYACQIKQESFLEDISNILQSGEVPNLYGKDEIPQVLDGVRKAARQAGVEDTSEALWEFYVDRCVPSLSTQLTGNASMCAYPETAICSSPAP